MLRPGITGYATLCADRLRICAAMCKFPLNCCRRRPCALGKSVRPVLAEDETAATAGATGRASGAVAAVAPVADEHRTAAGTTEACAPWRTVAPGTAVAEEQRTRAAGTARSLAARAAIAAGSAIAEERRGRATLAARADAGAPARATVSAGTTVAEDQAAVTAVAAGGIQRPVGAGGPTVAPGPADPEEQPGSPTIAASPAHRLGCQRHRCGFTGTDTTTAAAGAAETKELGVTAGPTKAP